MLYLVFCRNSYPELARDNTMSIDNSNGNDGVTKRILERKTATAVSIKYKIDFSFRRVTNYE